MSSISFIDTPSLIHAAAVGLRGWIPGTPFPASARQFLDQLVLGGGRKVTNSLILDEIARGSSKDDGFLESWLTEKISTNEIEFDELSPAEFEAYRNMTNGGERSLIEVTAETRVLCSN